MATIHFIDKSAGADGEDGDVRGGLDLRQYLVEGNLGESVAACANEDDVLATFDAAGAIERLVEGVEHVGIGEARDHQGADGLADGILVVGEVGEDVGAEVVGDDGDVVIGTERTEEDVGGVLHVADEVVAVGGELEQLDGSNGSLSHANAGDGLGDAVFEDEEVGSFEARDELVGLVENDVDVKIDDWNVNAERVGLVVRVFDLGFGWRRRRRGFLGLFFLLENDGAVVSLGPDGVGRGLLGRGLRRWSFLSAGGREQKSQGCEKKGGRIEAILGTDAHDLKLYSGLFDADIGLW